MTRRSFVPDALAALKPYAAPASVASIKLDANESPFGLSAPLQEQLARELAAIAMHRYPDPRATALRETLARELAAAPEELVLGCGSDEVIALLLTAFRAPPRLDAPPTILVPTPTFVMYRIGAIAHGLTPIEVPLRTRDWSLDVEAMLGAIDKHAPNLVFLATPNNPTGNAFATDDIGRIVDHARGTSLVVIDEAYGAFAGGSLAPTFAHEPHVVMMGTLSKIGFAAARVGWIRLSQELAVEVEKVRQPFNVNALSQRVATFALVEARGEMQQAIASVRSERARVLAELRKHPKLLVYPTDANFVLVRDASRKLVPAAAHAGIALRDFHAHGGALAEHVRITFGTPRENDALLDVVRATFG